LRRRRLLVRLGIQQGRPIDPDDVVSRAAPPDLSAELKSVYGLLDRLPAGERVALVLRRVEGLEIPQVAEHMGISISTVKRRLNSAEARLERARKR
jgi:RNA polymerase sigma-70 factor (ECF subfamily)